MINIRERTECIISNIVEGIQASSTQISEAVQEIMALVGSIFVPVTIPETLTLTDIQNEEDSVTICWEAESSSACCSNCGTISTKRSGTYYTRFIQDLPIQQKTTYHQVKTQRFYCKNANCSCNNFFEQYDGFVDKHGRMTKTLEEHICRLGVETSAEGAARILESEGVYISGDTVLNIVKEKGLEEMNRQLSQDNVKTVGIDDINRRKGNSSSACTVFINEENKQFLTIVPGKTGDVVTNFLANHPSVEAMTRDRDTAYASAGNKAGLKQVAD